MEQAQRNLASNEGGYKRVCGGSEGKRVKSFPFFRRKDSVHPNSIEPRSVELNSSSREVLSRKVLHQEVLN